MWFGKRNRLEPKAAEKAKTYLGKPAPVGAEGQPQVSLAVSDVLPRQSSAASLEAPNSSLDLRLRNRSAQKFEPDWSRIARNFVIDPRVANHISSPYDFLRMRCLKSLEKNCWSTVAVTSPTRGAGNTLTAINLAISIAKNPTHRVLLVELDLVNPSFNRTLGFEKFRGMADYLLDEAELSEIVVDIGVDGLAIIPAGSPVANSSGLLSSRRMAQFLAELERLHPRQVVLFDLPSVLTFDDAIALSPLVDCALLVVEEGATKVSEVRRALTRLEQTQMLGVVLNRSVEFETQ